MSESQREQWVEDLRDYEHEAEMLTRSMSDLQRAPNAGPSAYLMARVTRHRIRLALLEARLDAAIAAA